jgi:hypothetical protein
MDIAEFMTAAPFQDVVRHYSTNLGIAVHRDDPSPEVFRKTDASLLLRQKRQRGDAALLTDLRKNRERICVFCFSDNSSTQTQVSVSWIHNGP